MEKGIVIKSTGSWFTVKYTNKIINCKIRGKFRTKGIRATNPVAVGDSVGFDVLKDGTGIIHTLDDRKNYIIRKATNLSKKSHIIAANVDQAVLLATMILPETPFEFIDRFLVTAEIYKIPAKIIFNKTDIYTPELMDYTYEVMDMYKKIGYECFAVSAVSGENLNAIINLFKDKITVISGNSGVGKSTLINKIDSNLNLKTGEISEYHLSGKHTTTFAEMFDLEFGGSVIDTPGIRGFGVIDMNQEDISHNFPEMFRLLENCKFYNCTHTHEPNCAVKEAVETGEIDISRYRSYLSLLEGDDKYRKNIYE